MAEAFIQVEHQGMVYIYREAAVHPGAQKYLDDYPLPGEAAGQCDEFAAKLADYFRSIGENNFQVYAFLVNGKSSHIVLKKDGVYYDPTGIQFGQPLKAFTDQTMPAIYQILKKLDNRQYTNKRMEKVYVSSPGDAPKGVALKRGPRGGYYYDEPVKGEPKKEEPSLKQKRKQQEKENRELVDEILNRYPSVRDEYEDMLRTRTIADADRYFLIRRDLTADKVRKDMESKKQEPASINTNQLYDGIIKKLKSSKHIVNASWKPHEKDEDRIVIKFTLKDINGKEWEEELAFNKSTVDKEDWTVKRILGMFYEDIYKPSEGRQPK